MGGLVQGLRAVLGTLLWVLLGHRGSKAPSCRALLQILLLLWGLLNVNLPHRELLVVDFAVVFLSPQYFLRFQHVSFELWNGMSLELQA